MLHRKGDFVQAEALFRQAVEAGRSTPDVLTPDYEAWNRPADAARYKAP